MSDPSPVIEPAPTPEEAAAIAAVLRLLRAAEVGEDVPAPPSLWHEAARREAIGSSGPWEPLGWKRAGRLSNR